MFTVSKVGFNGFNLINFNNPAHNFGYYSYLLLFRIRLYSFNFNLSNSLRFYSFYRCILLYIFISVLVTSNFVFFFQTKCEIFFYVFLYFISFYAIFTVFWSNSLKFF